MRPGPYLTALVVLLPVLLAAMPAEAGTSRVLTITTSSAKPAVAFKAFDGHPPKLFDFNGDGRKEIVLHNDNKRVYVFDSKTGKLLAELQTRYPGTWGARPLNGVEAAVLQTGGATHIIAANSAAYVTDFRFDGVGSDGKFRFTKVWERRLSDCYSNPGSDSKVVFSDLDRDGDLEILAQTEEVGVYALHHTGSLMWKKCIGGGNASPGAGDLNGDGWPEAVFTSDGGRITAVNGRTGSTMWQRYVGGAMPVGPAVAQLDGKGGKDVVVGVRDKHDCTNYQNNHVKLYAYSGSGSLLWMRQHPDGNPLTYTTPIVHDVDNNGQQDVVWADWNTQGHKCGNWEVTGPANFYRYDAAGNLRWRTVLNTYWNNKDLALADVDADGVQEVLANGPNGGHDGIWYLNSRTGAKEAFVSTYPWKVTRGPVVADLWGTGTMQWVVPVYAAASSVSGGGVLVYDTGVKYNAAWPHAPSVSMGGGGATASEPDPAPATGTEPAPAPAPGTFAATFRLAEDVNEWWVEAYVDAAEPVAAVDARVEQGSWRGLAKRSWGAWAASFHVPRGSEVQLRATSASGDEALSGTYRWLEGGEPAPEAGSGDEGSFEATFEPRAVGNDWWVEARVRSAQEVAMVDARVDEGAWKGLDRTRWGTWAKSFHVPDGSLVRFRALGAGGGEALSEPVAWT